MATVFRLAYRGHLARCLTIFGQGCDGGTEDTTYKICVSSEMLQGILRGDLDNPQATLIMACWAYKPILSQL